MRIVRLCAEAIGLLAAYVAHCQSSHTSLAALSLSLSLVSHTVWQGVSRVFSNTHSTKICYCLKPQLCILRKLEVEVAGRLADPRLAHWLLEPEQNKDMESHDVSGIGAFTLRYVTLRTKQNTLPVVDTAQ